MTVCCYFPFNIWTNDGTSFQLEGKSVTRWFYWVLYGLFILPVLYVIWGIMVLFVFYFPILYATFVWSHDTNPADFCWTWLCVERVKKFWSVWVFSVRLLFFWFVSVQYVTVNVLVTCHELLYWIYSEIWFVSDLSFELRAEIKMLACQISFSLT